VRKREVTAANKDALQEAIKILDGEKNKDLLKTIKEVNRNFTDIF
jgi:chromosome segregation ATPase